MFALILAMFTPKKYSRKYSREHIELIPYGRTITG